MKSLRVFGGCTLLLVVCVSTPASAQGTGKVQEFFKKYFGEYFPKTTRSYTLYGNALNGPADFNAGLPVPEDHEGNINSIIVRRGSPGRSGAGGGGSGANQQMTAPAAAAGGAGSWQPMPNFAPYPSNPGGHRGRSDIPDELEERAEEGGEMEGAGEQETPIITAEDVMGRSEDIEDIREISMESSMSFGGQKGNVVDA